MRRARVIPYSTYDPADFFTDATRFFIAEGDSWFSLAELVVRIPPTDSLLHQLFFDSQVDILQLAEPGDLITRMADWSRNPAFRKILREGFGSNAGGLVDAILLSGGGNDLFAALDEGHILQNAAAGANAADPASYVSQADIDALATYIRLSYATLVKWRDGPGNACKDAPIFVHTYDIPQPRNAPALVLAGKPKGPWLYKALNAPGRNIPPAMHLPIATYIATLLGNVLMSLDSNNGAAGNKLPNFHVIDTLGTLTRSSATSTGIDGDWVNEIHPSRDGYGKVGAKLAASLRNKLGI